MTQHLNDTLVRFLSDPHSYAHHPDKVTVKQTHASVVFLAPPYVYKIKKPVDLGFLDFSTLERRRVDCEREVRLNARLCHDLYLGVEPISRQEGSYAIGGSGEVIEYAVKMRLLGADGFLEERLRAGKVDSRVIECIADRLVRFYQDHPATEDTSKWGAVDLIRAATDENFDQTQPFIGRTLDAMAFEVIREFTYGFFLHQESLFQRRQREGWIRDCHGDLHLDHIHVCGDDVQIYDCIEFNDRFRCIDVASDLAFLIMDLDHQGFHAFGRVIARRVSQSLGDEGMQDLLPFYQCYRAYVRGKVESMHSVAEGVGDAEANASASLARSYFRWALRYAVAGTEPVVIACMGRVASGKSALAHELGSSLGWPVISSDTVRKTLAGVPLTHRGSAEERRRLYNGPMTERTYAAMGDQAVDVLASHDGVILDATFSAQTCRSEMSVRIANAGARLVWLVLEVDPALAVTRLRRRKEQSSVVSDAREEDHALLGARYQEPDELPAQERVDLRSDRPVKEVAEAALRILATRQAIRPPHQKESA